MTQVTLLSGKLPLIQEQARRCEISKAIPFIMEPSPESDLEEMAETGLSDEKYVPEDGNT